MVINKYYPFAFIYFFINSVALPFGLTWMALLAPFLYVWILLKRKEEVLLPFLGVLLPFIVLHILFAGVQLNVYLVSLLNLLMVYIFCQAFYTFLLQKPRLDKLFKTLVVINFICCIIGIIFYFTPWVEIFWIRQELTKGINDFYRFKLFTYEASYYATLFVPLFFYFFLQYLLGQNTVANYLLIPFIFLPLIISFSMGVIACSIIAVLLTFILYLRKLIIKRRVFNLVVNLAFALSMIAFFMIVYFRHNPIFTRLINIVSGQDTSANGRTTDAYYFARQMLGDNNTWWGIGLGQIKLQGHDLIQGYYLYNMDFVATLPNSMAEMLAIFGWVGVLLKLSVELFLFFYTKVYANYYRMLLFIFIFIYQFTGSFITNLAEYVIWILAFSPFIFKQFDTGYQRRSLDAAKIAAS
jgi:hypothetical protein